ncbi:hypothetical protein LTR85_005379 [Meristemomyces frigidus]|nr:hypothetical protein LTR85_005379 [Meristemomyces frigidus]
MVNGVAPVAEWAKKEALRWELEQQPDAPADNVAGGSRADFLFGKYLRVGTDIDHDGYERVIYYVDKDEKSGGRLVYFDTRVTVGAVVVLREVEDDAEAHNLHERYCLQWRYSSRQEGDRPISNGRMFELWRAVWQMVFGRTRGVPKVANFYEAAAEGGDFDPVVEPTTDD